MVGKRYLALFVSIGMASPVIATEAYVPVCEHKGTNGMVTMLLCPEGLSLEDQANEGRAICQDRKPCGAWIWTDAAMVPDEAPDSHDKLPGESVRVALGVWMNEVEQLVTLIPPEQE